VLKFKRKFRRHRVKMDVEEVVYGRIDRNDLTQDRDRCWALVNAVVNLRGL
jgi:hypothetical protein